MELFRYFHHIDKDITLAINGVNSPASDWVWTVFSDRNIWFILYAIVLFMFFWKLGWKRAIVVTVSCILCVVATDQFANFTKDYFQRLRPCLDGEMIERGLHILEGAGNKFGFYSAHAANTMGFAVCSWIGFRNDGERHKTYGLCIVVWALLVGFSRIFVGKHFFGDVLVGFAIGALFGWILASMASFAIRRFFPSDQARPDGSLR